jgi:hypothetical protein
LDRLNPDGLRVAGLSAEHDLVGSRVEVSHEELAGVNVYLARLDAELAVVRAGDGENDAAEIGVQAFVGAAFVGTHQSSY